MANPEIISLIANKWAKVETNVTSGFVHVKSGDYRGYIQTYRETGGESPSLKSEGVSFLSSSEIISAAAGIDVYVMSIGADGSVRVDL